MLSRRGRLSSPSNFGETYLRSSTAPLNASTHPLGASNRPRPTPHLRPNRLADFLAKRLEILLHLSHELVGACTVDQAMVIAQRQVNHRTDGDGIVAIFIGDHERLLGDSSHSHDCGV